MPTPTRRAKGYELRKRVSSIQKKVLENIRRDSDVTPVNLEPVSVATRSANKRRRHRLNSVTANDGGSSVSTSSNGYSSMSMRTRQSDRNDKERTPLAPLRCAFSSEEETPRPKRHCQRNRNILVSCPTPRKRPNRFRLLRNKNVSWDETLDLEQSDTNHHLTRFRAAGGKWRQKNARELVLQKAKQSEPVSWDEFLTGMTKENFVFLGVGDFSEVYCYSSGKVSIVIKVMPAVDDDDNEAPAEIKGYSHYLPEIMASKLVTKLAYKFHNNKTHGFAKLMGLYVVKGRLPDMLYDTRTNTQPFEDSLYDLPADQEWLVMKYPFVGKPLESIDLMELNSYGLRSIIAQIAISLAAAEQAYEFEHRDLHFGNLLIQSVRFDRLRYRVDGENFSVPSEGNMVTIIDFTLARVKDEDGEIYFVDLANDEEDEEEDELEILDHLKVHYETKEMNENRWNIYNPRSNVIWMKYLCDKFLHSLNALPMGERLRKRNDNTHNAIYSELDVLAESISCYNSCSELIRDNFFFDPFRKSKDDSPS